MDFKGVWLHNVAMSDKNRTPQANIPPFGLRMQPALKARVEAEAKKNNRSMNSEIIDRIEKSFLGNYTSFQTEQAEDIVNAVRDVVTAKLLSDTITPTALAAFDRYMTAKKITNRDLALTILICESLIDLGFLDEDAIPMVGPQLEPIKIRDNDGSEV